MLGNGLIKSEKKGDIQMESTKRNSFPRWIFAVSAVGALIASGIFIGIMSIEGVAGLRLAQAVGFGIVGLIMFWGAINNN
jgi:hypothetical protein